jgi:hypothetical protein
MPCASLVVSAWRVARGVGIFSPVSADHPLWRGVMSVAPQDEHRWLERLVGEWTFEAEDDALAAEGKHRGTERVRSLAGIWVVCEGQGQTPGAEAGTSVMTLGYDPARGRFVGTFVASMMTHLWIYDGALDAAGRALTLETEGPSFTTEGQLGRYRDVVTFEGDDHRVLTSHHMGHDGRWNAFMTMHYRRTA